MSVLVTGATGHLGPHLIAELLEDFRLRSRVRRGAQQQSRAGSHGCDRSSAFRTTMLDRAATSGPAGSYQLKRTCGAGRLDLCRDAKVILHAAADTRFTAPDEVMRRANVHSTLAMCRFAETCPRLRQFLFVSTACVAGRTYGMDSGALLDDSAGFANAYEQTKWEAEQIVADTRLPARIARLPHVSEATKLVTSTGSVPCTTCCAGCRAAWYR